MRRKRFFTATVLLSLLIALLAVPACDSVTKSPTSAPSPTPTQSPTPKPTTIAPPYAIINGHIFLLEIADDEATRNKGFSNRTDLPENSAMLFIFPHEEYLSFWMKDTLIPLDILFLDSNRKIVDIQTMQPELGIPDNELRIYRSAAPARYAIEMNAGLSTQLGFTVGMLVELNTDN